MRSRNRKAVALVLAASLIFSFNTVSFAAMQDEYDVVSTDGEEAVDTVTAEEREEEIIPEEDPDSSGSAVEVVEDSGAELSSGEEGVLFTDDDAQNALSGNIVLTSNTPDITVSPNDTVSVNDVKDAIFADLEMTVGDSTYYVKETKKGFSLMRKSDDKEIAKEISSNSALISLNSIRKAGSPLKEAGEIKYADNAKGLISSKGNQLVHYTVTIDKTKIVGARDCNTVEGDILLKVWTSGSVSSQRIKFADGKFSVLVVHDACVEYRGTRVVATSHHQAVSDDSLSKEVSGTVDGAVGVSVRLEKLSENGVWIPIDGKSYGNYFWKDRTGITLKKPKVYNGKKVGSCYDEDGPYFMIPVSVKKKQMENDLLTQDQKQSLKNVLKSTKIHFTIEPRKLSTDDLTYDKYDADKFYVKKLTYNSGKNTLKGTIQFRTIKTNKSTLNARKLKNVGKKLKIVSKSKYEANTSKKNDAYFEYSSEKGGATLTGVNGYYGNAFVKGSRITVK